MENQVDIIDSFLDPEDNEDAEDDLDDLPLGGDVDLLRSFHPNNHLNGNGDYFFCSLY